MRLQSLFWVRHMYFLLNLLYLFAHIRNISIPHVCVNQFPLNLGGSKSIVLLRHISSPIFIKTGLITEELHVIFKNYKCDLLSCLQSELLEGMT